MSKTVIDGVKTRKNQNGNRISKKGTSHSTYTCTRHPNSKRCKK
jgi:hypothetical protein